MYTLNIYNVICELYLNRLRIQHWLPVKEENIALNILALKKKSSTNKQIHKEHLMVWEIYNLYIHDFVINKSYYFENYEENIFSLKSICSVVSDSLRSHVLQHSRLLCPSLSPRVWSNSCPLSQWCNPTVSSSVVLFFSCPQSFPESGSFPISRLFTSGGQSIGASTSAPLFAMNTQGWFSLGLTGLTSLQSKRLSRVFSSITVQKQQSFSA